MGAFDDLVPGQPKADKAKRKQATSGGAFDDLIPSDGVTQPQPQPRAETPKAERVPLFADTLVAAGMPKGLREPVFYVENALRAARQGATFGFSDEAVGARDALAAALTGGDPAAEYRRSRDLERARLRQFEEDSPTAAFLGNIGGGLVPITGPAKAVAALPSLPARIGQAAKSGAKYGALAGLGVGEGDVRQQLESAGKGALIGAAVSPVLTGGLTAAGAVGGRVREALAKRGAPRGTSPGAAPEAGERALDLVSATMRRAGTTPERVRESIARDAELGEKPEMLADYLGDQGARRLYSVRALGGPESSQAVERLAARGEGTSARVAEDLQKAVGQRGQSLSQLDTRIENRRKLGNTLYREAFKKGEVTNADTLGLLQNPRVAEILKKASDRRAKVADLRYEEYSPLFREAEGGPVLARQPTVEDLHMLKTSLDDDIRQAFQAGEGQLGGALRDFKNRIVRNLEEEVPAYRKARETYKGDIEIEEAITNGRNDILRKPVDELRRDFSALSGAEQDAYRSGAIDAILSRKVDPKVDSSDFARSLWGNADSRGRLQLLVKGEKELEKLIQQFQREQRIARTNRGVLGGSQTAMRTADIEDQVAGTLADVASQGPQGAFVSTVSRWIRRSGGLTEAVADDVAKLLTAEGPETIGAVLESLKAREQQLVMRALARQQAGASAASTATQQQRRGNIK